MVVAQTHSAPHMNYDLAKQLKECGFPQFGGGRWIDPSGNTKISHGTDDSYLPTLSEIIEACGEDFAGLGRNKFENGEVKWLASQNIDKFGNWLGRYGHGSSPEIAVAKLWIALHS
jgi:hypothetical protein